MVYRGCVGGESKDPDHPPPPPHTHTPGTRKVDVGIVEMSDRP